MKIKLNLLSTQRKEAIEESRKMRLISKWGLEAFGILLICSILLWNINYVLKISSDLNLNDFGNEKIKFQYSEIEEYNSRVKQVNSKIAEIENIQKGQIYWSKLLFKLNNILIPEVTLNNLSNKEFTIFLVGKAKTRESLVLLKDALEQEDCFQEIKLPLSNLVSKDNVDFQIEFIVKEDCLKDLSTKQ